MLTFSNPRLIAEFDDWPSGSKRVKCKFEVEKHPKRGMRVLRSTTDKYGNWCKPKMTTYSPSQCIVDGSDGRTYILYWTGHFYGVWRSDFMQQMSVFPQDERFEELSGIMGNVVTG